MGSGTAVVAGRPVWYLVEFRISKMSVLVAACEAFNLWEAFDENLNSMYAPASQVGFVGGCEL